jgi:hypothetical protein
VRRRKDRILTIPQQVADADDIDSPISPRVGNIHTSPPPSFRSRTSSPGSRHTAVDQTLADTFDADGSDSDEDNDGDDRQRLMRGSPTDTETATEAASAPAASESTRRPPPVIQRRDTHLPVFTPVAPGRIYGGGSQSDGVFSNLSAKPELGEKLEEHPPVGFHHIPGAEPIC